MIPSYFFYVIHNVLHFSSSALHGRRSLCSVYCAGRLSIVQLQVSLIHTIPYPFHWDGIARHYRNGRRGFEQRDVDE